MKHKNSYVKKCIAGVLTIALAAGVCQSYGSIEASAGDDTAGDSAAGTGETDAG